MQMLSSLSFLFFLSFAAFVLPAADLTLTASGEINVPAGETNFFDRVSGKYTLTKTGGGTLRVRYINAQTKIIVAAGELLLDNPRPAAMTNAYFHVDASARETMELVQENGTNFVLRWNDCGGRAQYATNCMTEWAVNSVVLRSGANRPFLRKNDLNSLPVVDFGALVTRYNTNTLGRSLGYGAAMSFNRLSPIVTDAIAVVADGEDIPLWPDLVPNCASMVPQSVFANETTRTFQRGNYDTSKSATYTARCLLNDGAGALKVYPNGGSIWLNGIALTSYAKWKALPSGFNTIRIRPVPEQAATYPDHACFGSFAASRADANGVNRSYGGQSLAEYALFTNALADADAEVIDLHLRLKWRTTQNPSIRVKAGARFRLGANVTVVSAAMEVEDGADAMIPPATAVTVDTLLSAPAVFHLDASKTNTMVFTAENGTNFVTRWNDCAGGSNYATHDTTETTWRDDPAKRKPFFGPVTLNGLPVVDFGPALFPSKTNAVGRGLGYGAAMKFATDYRDLAEGITVMCDTEDLKTVGAGLYGSAFFSSTTSTTGARGETVKGANPRYFYWKPGETVKNGTLYVDGTALAWSAHGNANSYPAGFHVVNLVFSSVSTWNRADMLARMYVNDLSTWNTYGGQRIAEYMLFKEKMTDEERARVTAALRAKWFGAPHGARRYAALAVPPTATFSVVYETVTVDGTLALGGTLAAPGVSAGALAVAGGATLDGALILRDGAALSFAATETGVAELSAVSVAAASETGTISLALSRAAARRLRGKAVRLIASPTVDARLASYTAVCGGERLHLSVKPDGLYAAFSPGAFVFICR